MESARRAWCGSAVVKVHSSVLARESRRAKNWARVSGALSRAVNTGQPHVGGRGEEERRWHRRETRRKNGVKSGEVEVAIDSQQDAIVDREIVQSRAAELNKPRVHHDEVGLELWRRQ